MRQFLRTLVVHSARDLVRYRTFLLLVMVLLVADQTLKHVVKVERPDLAGVTVRQLGRQAAEAVYVRTPQILGRWLLDWRLPLVVVALFGFKQLTSMWPSSDMRRMHRRERHGFGLVGSLLALRWQQFAWDAIAVSTLCGLTAVWIGAWFLVTRWIWRATDASATVGVFLALAACPAPVVMAGLSYSSKLAVLHGGSFGEKLRLFFRLFTSARVFWYSWLFYAARIVIEAVAVVAVPVVAVVTIPNLFLRLLLDAAVATPAYSYLKMISFKFFLHIYRDQPLVRDEYAAHYAELASAAGPEEGGSAGTTG